MFEILQKGVLTDLRKAMSCLKADEPKAIFKFYIHLNVIKKLKLLPESKGISKFSREFVNFS